MQSNSQTVVNIIIYMYTSAYTMYTYKYYYLYAKQTRQTKQHNVHGNKSR